MMPGWRLARSETSWLAAGLSQSASSVVPSGVGRAIFTSCFEWPSGAAEFASGEVEVAGRAVTEVNTVGCLWEAVQSQLTVDELEPELAGRMNQIVERGRATRTSWATSTTPALLPLLDALDEGLRLEDLFERFQAARPSLVRALWIMLSLGIAKAEGPALARDHRCAQTQREFHLWLLGPAPPGPPRARLLRVLGSRAACGECTAGVCVGCTLYEAFR